jgi:predicted ATPase/DNA-binding SARP family transcriptional activator
VDVLVLGPLEVWRGGRPLAVRRGRPRRLLLSLLLRRGGAVPPDTLIDQLWGDEPPVNADNALQILVSYLRKVVGGEGLRIERAPGGYRLVVDPGSVDLVRFEELVGRAGAAALPPGERLELADGALALWRGPALSEAADDAFAEGDIVRLEELRLQAHEVRAAALLELGRHDDALPDLVQLVREHPFRERLHGQLALALYRAGRQADALAALDHLRQDLVEDLGLDPTPELLDLGQRILRHDASLAAPSPALSPTVPPANARDSRAAEPAGSDERLPHVPSARPRVPVPVTSLIGREEQVRAVRDRLERHRLVTLTGPGGAGKTRVAAAAVRAEEHVWWADLSSAADAAGLHAAVAGATGTALTSRADAVEEIARGIGRSGGLLVLDTCEHLVADVHVLVTGLLAGCPDLRVLATSRQPVGADGELVWPVPPLSLPRPQDRTAAEVGRSHAVQLFCDRAAASRPGFALDDANAADVGAVCLLLDGLPLAIELAAGHAAALSPVKTAALLRDRMRLLGDGPHERGRHAGLRAAVDWSYELLSADEALFFERLSVFAGPFSLEAAVEVAGAGLAHDALRLLLSLARQSLVSASSSDRFQLLDTVRAYAAERLAARGDEERRTRDRHARWHHAFAEDADRNIRGADQAGWLGELRAVTADLRSALHHCFTHADLAAVGARLVCSLSWFWSFEGSFAEATAWIAQARAAGPHEPVVEARLHLAAGMHAESAGDLRTADAECTAAAVVFAQTDDVRGEARSLLHLGTARWALGRLDDAASAQDRSAALFRSVRDDGGAGLALVLRARTALDREDSDGARRYLLESRHVLRRAGDAHLLGLADDQMARTCLLDGALPEAERLARTALRTFEGVGYPEGIVAALHTLGQARLRRGDAADAIGHYVRAVQQAVDLDHASAVAEGLELLAEARALQARSEGAALLLGGAEAIRLEKGLPRTPWQQQRLCRWIAGGAQEVQGVFAALRAEGALMTPQELLVADSAVDEDHGRPVTTSPGPP